MSTGILIATFFMLCILIYITFFRSSESYQEFNNVDNKNMSIYKEETLGPRKEYVVTSLDQCMSLCTSDGNRPGILTYYINKDDMEDVHDTERCYEGCKKFIEQQKK